MNACEKQLWPIADRASLRGIRATVMGLGREGIALTRFLAESGAEVLVTDRQEPAALTGRLAALTGLPVRYALGGHPSWAADADVIFVSPGIPRDVPFLLDAVQRGVRLSSETELFFHLCPAPIIGITGSSGKTTTTTLVGNILRAAGQTTWVGGNIGQPLLNDVTRIGADDKVVLELSSFQLEHLRISPRVAAVLNITPNHLDRHPSMEAYIEAKRQIFIHQKPSDAAVFGYDDPVARQLLAEYQANGAGLSAFFSGSTPARRGAWLQGEELVLRSAQDEGVICRRGEILLRGWHNLLNVLAACAIAGEAGASISAMREAVTTFAGVEHRLELVREWRGVRFVNDSIATSPERAIAALRSYEEPIILLAGGRDKHLPWDEWADLVVKRVRHLILFGEAAPLIERVASAGLERAAIAGAPILLTADAVHHAGTLEQAVVLAARLAQPGDVVLLSPGGTSFDAFVDFAQRGERFRELVNAL